MQTSRLDPQALTLSLTPQISTPSTSLSWNSDAPISSFGKPDPFSTDLSAGGLTASEPIDVPAGPGGLTPPVSLTYSSESVNSQHSYSAAAGWVGEGWNLSLGAITWNQHNVVAGCTPQPGCDWWNPVCDLQALGNAVGGAIDGAAKFTSNTWLNTLYAATGLPGGQAEVNLDVWQTDTNPSSISGITSVCEGSTDGITSTSNC